MVKTITAAFSLLLSFAATIPAAAQKRVHTSGATAAKPVLKFLDAIQVRVADATPVYVSSNAVPETTKEELQIAPKPEFATSSTNAIEYATGLQLKFAVLLDTEVEQIQNAALFSAVDEWFGTRYVLGGSSKTGVDCSAFVQAVYDKLFQIPMPRTVREQYKAVRPISRTELQQGDLIFFNTRGSSVSHVGIYLQNNKFVHAASSGGVMISDLFEDYWVKRFKGAGRHEKEDSTQILVLKP